MTVLKRYLSDFLNLLFPPLCLACRANLMASNVLLCVSCKMQLPRAYGHIKLSTQVVKSVFSFLEYEKGNLTQVLIHSLKYKKKKEVGNLLGFLCAKAWQKTHTVPKDTVIIPVPLHKKRLKKRGYNQAEHFAQGLSQVLSVPIDTGSLVRILDTESQTTKNREARRISMQAAFKLVDAKAIKGKNILLVDDVLTTGSTVTECASCLVPFVKSIRVIVIAS